MTARAVALTATLLACGPPCGDGLVCALAGTGELGFNGDGGDALQTRLASPTSVTTDPDGRPVVVDYSNMRVRVLDDDGRLVTIAGNGTHAYSELGLDPLASPLENPIDAAWGPDGRLYVLPQHEGRLIRVSDDGVLEPAVGTGAIDDTGDGGDALDATMGYGGGVAFTADGTTFVSDSTFSRVRRVAPDGTIDTVLGTGSGGLGAPGPGPSTAIRGPQRVVVDAPRGRLLVADGDNHRVLAVDLATLDATLVAGTGTSGFAGDGGPATAAQLHTPTGLAVTADGTVLISDLRNDRVRAVRPDGTIDTVLGVADRGEPVRSGPPDTFGLRFPAGLHLTPDGDLLIAEFGGHRLLRWTGAIDAL